MKENNGTIYALIALILISFLLTHNTVSACSTFKLQNGDNLIYGHNLDEPNVEVPGMIFINKRGIFKTGRSWSEIITKEQLNPSSHCWISRYGSVTFNIFGKDLPDGGLNEEGLCIWEMSEQADYPRGNGLPKLNQMSWMQYILDNCSTLDEAVLCASEIEIDGWGWHYFIGDAKGNTAAIEFKNKHVVIYKGDNMPVPALCNTSYSRELELLKDYKGFGGQRDLVLSDHNLPRFVTAAVMIRDYISSQNIVNYGFVILKNLRTKDLSDWSVVFDAGKRKCYFKTAVNPEVKSFSMDEVDFSNKSPVSILNIDIKNGGDIYNLFQPYSNEKIKEFTKLYVFPVFPEEFFTRGGITFDEYLKRISTLGDAAALKEKQYFRGVWKNNPDKTKDEIEITIKLTAQNDAVLGQLIIPKFQHEAFEIDHINLIGNNLKFTCESKSMSIEVYAALDLDKMNVNLYGNKENYEHHILLRNLGISY
jgi:choloylglycine hydrolase